MVWAAKVRAVVPGGRAVTGCRGAEQGATIQEGYGAAAGNSSREGHVGTEVTVLLDADDVRVRVCLLLQTVRLRTAKPHADRVSPL